MSNYVRIGKSVYNAMRSSGIARELVYTTRKPNEATATVMDFFKDCVAKKIKPQKLAKDVFQKSSGISQDINNSLEPIAKKFGIYGGRIKTEEKVAGKVANAINKIDGNTAYELLQTGDLTRIIGDGYGSRVIFNNINDMEKFLGEVSKKCKDFKIINVENYHGVDILPYISEAQKNTLVNRYGIPILDKLRKTGFTRVNVNAMYNGVHVELQLGGKYTTRFGEVEHYLYDMRGGVKPDLSKLNEEQKKLFNKMKQTYQQVIMKNETLDGIYKKYMNDFWGSLKLAEEKGLPFPEFPPKPAGIPRVLTMENLFKLEHV